MARLIGRCPRLWRLLAGLWMRSQLGCFYSRWRPLFFSPEPDQKETTAVASGAMTQHQGCMNWSSSRPETGRHSATGTMAFNGSTHARGGGGRGSPLAQNRKMATRHPKRDASARRYRNVAAGVAGSGKSPRFIARHGGGAISSLSQRDPSFSLSYA